MAIQPCRRWRTLAWIVESEQLGLSNLTQFPLPHLRPFINKRSADANDQRTRTIDRRERSTGTTTPHPLPRPPSNPNLTPPAPHRLPLPRTVVTRTPPHLLRQNRQEPQQPSRHLAREDLLRSHRRPGRQRHQRRPIAVRLRLRGQGHHRPLLEDRRVQERPE